MKKTTTTLLCKAVKKLFYLCEHLTSIWNNIIADVMNGFIVDLVDDFSVSKQNPNFLIFDLTKGVYVFVYQCLKPTSPSLFTAGFSLPIMLIYCLLSLGGHTWESEGLSLETETNRMICGQYLPSVLIS